MTLNAEKADNDMIDDQRSVTIATVSVVMIGTSPLHSCSQ